MSFRVYEAFLRSSFNYIFKYIIIVKLCDYMFKITKEEKKEEVKEVNYKIQIREFKTRKKWMIRKEEIFVEVGF